MALLCCLLLAIAARSEIAPYQTTAGWENVEPKRAPFPATEILWQAMAAGDGTPALPQSVDGCGITALPQLVDGAEGEVTITNGAIRIVKTNDKGRIVVEAPSFLLSTGQVVRLMADVSASTRLPETARGWLCGWSGRRQFVMKDPISAKCFASGGRQRTRLVNSAPGMTYRKYAHAVAEEGRLTAAIVVEGPPSVSTWTNWAAEDYAAAQREWTKHYAKLSSLYWRGDLADEAEFDAALRRDVEHTAAVVVKDGESRLVVDGRDAVPIVYRCKGGLARYAGKPLQNEGVRLGVISVRLAEYPGFPGVWSPAGFNVAALVEQIRATMRAGDRSLFILSLGVAPYPQFAEQHPDEIWRQADGSPVMGNVGSATPATYNDNAAANVGDLRWRWMSYASPSWKAAVKDVLVELVAALKRQGLSKRIVGVHFCGAHDGQFAVPLEDHSPCAKALYAARGGTRSKDKPGDYAFFCKQLGFMAVEEFSHFAKAAFGKPMIAVRWCMRPFFGVRDASYDVGSFLRSREVEVIVVQPTYNQRAPALAQGVRLPCESLHRHGKLMWFEFDLRTGAALEGWAKSVLDTQGLGQCDDLPMWRTTFRKHAGMMIAKRMGWWFYDMAAGWYRPPEIAADIGEVVREYAAYRQQPPGAWHAEVALVVDEAALFAERSDQVLGLQWPRTAAAGVPYDFVMAEDLAQEPALAGRYKAIVWCGGRPPDALGSGRAVMVAPKAGYTAAEFHRFACAAGAYVALPPNVAQVDMNGDFVSIHALATGEAELRLPVAGEWMNMKSGERVAAEGGRTQLALTAGETVWLKRKQVK